MSAVQLRVIGDNDWPELPVPAEPLQQARREAARDHAAAFAAARRRSQDTVDALAQALEGAAHVCNPPAGKRYQFGQQWHCPCGKFWRHDGSRFRPEAEARGLHP